MLRFLNVRIPITRVVAEKNRDDALAQPLQQPIIGSVGNPRAAKDVNEDVACKERTKEQQIVANTPTFSQESAAKTGSIRVWTEVFWQHNVIRRVRICPRRTRNDGECVDAIRTQAVAKGVNTVGNFG